MKLSRKEIELIASTPQKECWICDALLNKIYTDLEGNNYIPNDYLRCNKDIREHLKQIIRR